MGKTKGVSGRPAPDIPGRPPGRKKGKSENERAANCCRRDCDLTETETKVLKLIAAGLKRKQVAGQLYVSIHTVKTHIERTYKKLEVHSAAAAVDKSVREGILHYRADGEPSDMAEQENQPSG